MALKKNKNQEKGKKIKLIKIEESKKIQLQLLETAHDFCEQRGLSYYLMFGTLLGAVRHNGFIPWDDDIDIGMPRKDYERFFSEFGVQDTAKAINCFSDSKYYLPFGKIIDTRTILVENTSHKCEIGVYIDVFPIDEINDDETIDRIVSRRLLFLRNLISLNILPNSNKRKGIKKIIHKLLRIILFFVNYNVIARKMNIIAKQQSGVSKFGIIANVDKKGIQRRYEREWFNNSTEILFEKKMFRVPADADRLLTYIYGDYMALPPKEQQVSHHEYVQYWKE